MSDVERALARHLHACVAAVYHQVGSSASRFTNDGYAVCAYECARHFGALAFSWRALLDGEAPGDVALLEEVLTRATSDETGATTLYAVAIVVGPRLLVSARDALEVVTTPEFARTASATLDVTLAAMRRVEAAFARAVPEVDEAWRRQARDLVDLLEAGGMAESLGLGV
ncbi:MAG: hypothetical protein KGI14_04500 [Acidobacteriota bacterium]|nr:hypothetical protein [Acidobacteriota bacterium]